MVTAITYGCLALILLLSLACYSLRDFTRSRLELICRNHNRNTLLREILSKDEDTLLVCEMLRMLLIVVFAGLYVGFPLFPEDKWESAQWILAGRIAGDILLAVLCGHLLPRTIAAANAEGFLYNTWPVISFLRLLCTPYLMAFRWVETLMKRLAGREETNDEDISAFTEEIRTVVDEGERIGLMETKAGRLIQRVMELQGQDVSSVMTPRTEMVCIQKEVTLIEARTQLLDSRHSRIPIYGESPDDLIGILYARDLLQELSDQPDSQRKLDEIVREPLYVPETSDIESLLDQMKSEHVHMAIVLDEYGGVTGLVTMEDILEEIVGDIADEYDDHQEVEPIRQISDKVVEVQAKVHLDDLNERFTYGLPEDEDFDTIGGFVFSELGHVPKPEEEVIWQALRITVIEADKRKVIRVRIERDETLAMLEQNGN